MAIRGKISETDKELLALYEEEFFDTRETKALLRGGTRSDFVHGMNLIVRSILFKHDLRLKGKSTEHVDRVFYSIYDNYRSELIAFGGGVLPRCISRFSLRLTAIANQKQRVHVTAGDVVAAVKKCGIIFICKPPELPEPPSRG